MSRRPEDFNSRDQSAHSYNLTADVSQVLPPELYDNSHTDTNSSWMMQATHIRHQTPNHREQASTEQEKESNPNTSTSEEQEPSDSTIQDLELQEPSTSTGITHSSRPNARKRAREDIEKNEQYMEKRRKNNESAKRSREAKRAKEKQVHDQAKMLVEYITAEGRRYSHLVKQQFELERRIQSMQNEILRVKSLIRKQQQAQFPTNGGEMYDFTRRQSMDFVPQQQQQELSFPMQGNIQQMDNHLQQVQLSPHHPQQPYSVPATSSSEMPPPPPPGSASGFHNS